MRASILYLCLLVYPALLAQPALEQGVAAWNKGDRAAAVTAFEIAVEERPKSELAIFHLAHAYSHTPGKGKLAIPLYKTVLDRNPANLAARWNLAILQLNEPGAIERCRELSSAEPTNPLSHYLVAVMAWALSYNDPKNNDKLIEEGLAASRRALELNPAFAEAMIYQSLLQRSKARAAETEEDKKALFEASNAAFLKGKTLKRAVPDKLPVLNAEAMPPRLPIPPPPASKAP